MLANISGSICWQPGLLCPDRGLLVYFVVRMDRNQRASSAALAALRQQRGRGEPYRALGLLPAARRMNWARRWPPCR
jgi:hypothetical protein